MIEKNCRICSHSKSSIWARGLKDMRYSGDVRSWDYVRCNKCGVLSQVGLESFTDVSSYYPKSYETHSRPNVQTSVSLLRALIRKLSLIAFGYQSSGLSLGLKPFRRLLGRYVGWLDHSERIVDIGCGAGFYIDKMRTLGCNVRGFDFDKGAVGACAAAGLNVVHGGIDAAVSDTLFNESVVLHHVLEHLTDPVNDIRRVANAMTKGKELLLITPNSSSLLFNEFESLHWHMDAPRHTYLFGIKSSYDFVNAIGVKNYQIFTSNRSFWGCWSNSFRYKYGCKPKFFDRVKASFLFIRSFSDGKGDEIIIKISI